MDEQSSSSTGDKNLSRREREKLAHRLDIIEAATKVFAKKGFHSATLDEIAQEAEFSKGTLYLYFSSKEDLLYSILKSKFEPLMEKMESVFTQKKSFREELREMIYSLAEMAFKEKELFTLLVSQQIACHKALSEDKAQKIKAEHAKYDDIIIKRIELAIQSGELKDFDSRLIHGVIHGASEDMMFSRWHRSSLKELKCAIDAFIDMLFEGIARKQED
ncbi:TetR/AcrR family transcriptional regulator [Candidatus Omnitrophota bacterium]